MPTPTPTIKQQTQPESDLLTIHEVAQQLRVDDTTVRRWIKSGILDAVTLPHTGHRCAYRVKGATLARIMQGKAKGVR